MENFEDNYQVYLNDSAKELGVIYKTYKTDFSKDDTKFGKQRLRRRVIVIIEFSLEQMMTV